MLNSLNNFTVKKAKGLYLYGNQKVLDFSLGNGVNYFGHSNPYIVKSVVMEMFRKSTTGCISDKYFEVEKKLKEMLPENHHNFIFCTTGMEATTKSVRYAKAATGKPAVVSIKKGWHGQNDWTLEVHDGLPKINRWHISKISDLRGLWWRKVACVIYEPIKTSSPNLDLEFLAEIERWSKRENTLTICDEIVTGFRFTSEGLYSQLGLSPDIVCYGKILGGGLPLSLITMTDNVRYNTFDNKKVSTGGTFSGNALSMAATSAVLDEIKKTDYPKLMRRYRRYLKYANQKLNNNKIVGTGPIWRLEKPVCSNKMLDKGIFLAPNGVIHLSPLTKKKHIKRLVDGLTQN